MALQADELNIDVKVGADVAVQVAWADDGGSPMPASLPARAEVRDALDALVVAFDDDADAATAPHITCSDTSGIIQLTAPKAVTEAWEVGRYRIDIFVTVLGAAEPFTSGQYRPVLTGWFNILKRYTQGAP